MSKIAQQLKEMHITPKHIHIILCELCSGDHPIGFSPQTNEVNYVSNQQRIGQYQNYNFQRSINFIQGWKSKAGLSIDNHIIIILKHIYKKK